MRRAILRILLALFCSVLLIGCAPAPETHSEYKLLHQTPGPDAREAIQTLCTPEDAALLQEDFETEASLWQYTAEKEVFVQNGKKKLRAFITLELCTYKGYTAVYNITACGFADSPIWQRTGDVWFHVQNSDVPGKAPEVTIGVNVAEDRTAVPVLVVCSFSPDAETAL